MLEDTSPNFVKGSHTSQPEHFCKYIHRYCNQTRIEGYDYCIRHILEDKTAPFRQCTFVNQPNKKRCFNAAPKNDKRDSLCPFHTKQALVRIPKGPSTKIRNVEGMASYLRKLEHYCREPLHDPSYRRPNVECERSPIVDGRPSTLGKVESSLSGEPLVCRASADTIEDDFCFSDNKDCLENAGVYTHKEVLRIAKDKILKLQELYCEELKLVYHQMKECRRRFIAETESLNKGIRPATSLHPHEVNPKVLESLSKYHRYDGIHKMLRRRARDKRFGILRPSPSQKCTFQKDDVKCHENVLYMSKYCKTHILSDPKQVLYRNCGLGRNCQKPIYVFEGFCPNHFPVFAKKKPGEFYSHPVLSEEPLPSTSSAVEYEAENFQSMDDIAGLNLDAITSLGLDAITPGSLFGLDQFGDPGESTDTVPTDEEIDLMHIQPITPNLPADILSNTAKSDSD